MVCHEVVMRGIGTGQNEGGMGMNAIFPFLVTVPGSKKPIGQLGPMAVWGQAASRACLHSAPSSLWALVPCSSFHCSSPLLSSSLYTDVYFL